MYLGQRRIFPQIAARSWGLALFLAAPGTALHEGSHWLACKMFGLPVARVELFRPRRDEEGGGVRLGVVEHGSGGPVEMTIVAIAPLLFVPPMLLGSGLLFFGTELFSDPSAAVLDAAPWKQALALYLLLSSGWAAFPSPGDHIPLLGAVMLAVIIAAVCFLLGPENLAAVVRVAALVLVPAAASALLQLVVLLVLPRSLSRGAKVDRHPEER